MVPMKRAKVECGEGDDRPGKKAAHGHRASNITSSGDAGVAAEVGGAMTTTVSENGRGASLSPALAAPPASNLLARPAAADFHHGGGEELMALLEARVGRLFSLNAEYTHVWGAVPQNGRAPTARGAKGETTTAATPGSGGSSSPANGLLSTGVESTKGVGTNNRRRVLVRLKAVRAGQFVVFVQFDVPGNEFRPRDVSVLSWGEAEESFADNARSTPGNGNATWGVKTEGGQGVGGTGGGSFVDAMHGSKPLRTSQHTAFTRVSVHAFQVRVEKRVVFPTLCSSMIACSFVFFSRGAGFFFVSFWLSYMDSKI